MTVTQTPLRCPEHEVELVWREGRTSDRSMKCPAEADSFMSTENRWCMNCGARDASWISGTCSDCYRRLEAEAKESRRESQRESDARESLRQAITAAKTQGRPEVAEWLTDYMEGAL